MINFVIAMSVITRVDYIFICLLLQIHDIRLKTCPKFNVPTLIQVYYCKFFVMNWKGVFDVVDLQL